MTGIKQLKFDFRRRIPVILQTETAECGLACLAMMLGYYDKNTNLFELRSQYGTSSRGVTLHTLISIANDCGLITRPLSLELDEVPQLRLPCILHWDFNHFVVLTHASEKQFIIHDPAFGKRKLSRAEIGRAHV